SIVEGSGKNLNAVLTMKEGKSWATVWKQLRVDPSSIVNRLHIAENTIQAGHAGSRAQNTQGAQAGRQGNSYGPQGGQSHGGGVFNAWPSLMAKRYSLTLVICDRHKPIRGVLA